MPDPDLTLPDGLSGDALVESLWLDRPAVQNWARLTGAPADVHDARFALLDCLRADGGQFSSAHPDWMTSPKPGVDAWVIMDAGVALTLRADPQSGRAYRATNCVAPRRGRDRKAPPPAPAPRPALSADQLTWALTLTGDQLAERVMFSRHCYDRLAERAGADGDLPARLAGAVRASGRVLAAAPGWADGAGHQGPTLLCELDGEALALPLAPNRRADATDPPRPLVATTLIAYTWARADLPAAGAALAACVHVSERAARAYLRALGHDGDPSDLAAETARRIAAEGLAALEPDARTAARFGVSGPHLLLGDDLCLTLRPASAAQRAAGRTWFVSAYRPAITP